MSQQFNPLHHTLLRALLCALPCALRLMLCRIFFCALLLRPLSVLCYNQKCSALSSTQSLFCPLLGPLHYPLIRPHRVLLHDLHVALCYSLFSAKCYVLSSAYCSVLCLRVTLHFPLHNVFPAACTVPVPQLHKKNYLRN